ncbi:MULTISPECIES: hypothetical protein [Geobacillus]|uniref:hypothetical protein n=1 Tax=Geobacillus TaxID=129337 RepID=UPI0009AC8C7A|nr:MULTISPECIES: hypothetical protein [Geobacillus]OPX00662.1 hypothetical protein B1A75_17650 [Geobacillus sp. LEMMY01]OQP16148.1 hypothetical protein B1693_09625 [Geobacillus zalihae]
MPCSDIMMPHVVCTDASYYTENATSIDVTAYYQGGGIADPNGDGFIAPTWDYVMALEIYDGYWKAVELQTGYYRHQTPVKKFYLAGKKEGRYRVRMYYQARENEEYTGVVTTYSFMVYR